MANWNHSRAMTYNACLSRFKIGRCRYVNKEILVLLNTRRFFALSAITVASLSLAGCFTEEVDKRQTHEIQGLLYKIHDDDPFTGRVTNYPMSVLGLFSVGSCVIDFKKGLPDGEMRCSDNAGQLLGVGHFKAGKRDGEEEKYDAKTGKKIAEGNWTQGLQDGRQEQFNPQTGERILEVNYTAGKKDGRERAWDGQGKELIADLEWENGKQSGFDNRGTDQRTYLNGQFHGPQKQFSLDGKRFYVAYEENYQNGQQHGTQKRFDARGNVIELSEFDQGKLLARAIDKYNYDGQHVHHVSRLAIKDDVNEFDASDLSNDGKEQYWDDKGQLIRELEWKRGQLVSAIATVWAGGKKVSQFEGVARGGYDHQQNVVKQGQERLYDDTGTLQAIIIWNAGDVVHTLVALPADRRDQYPGKMALLDGVEGWGNPVTDEPAFDRQSRYDGGGYAVNYVKIVDIPAPGQAVQASAPPTPTIASALAAAESNDLDGCVQRRVDAVHAEDPEALIRADMLEEFEQDCK